MNSAYVLTPFVAWLMAGTIKFVINSIKGGELALKQIGYGGLPSNHSAIVSSMATLIALKEGVDNGIFGVAITLAFIVIMDAGSLRCHAAKHAAAINRLAEGRKDVGALREGLGHSRKEILAGVIVGIAAAWLTNKWLLPY